MEEWLINIPSKASFHIHYISQSKRLPMECTNIAVYYLIPVFRFCLKELISGNVRIVLNCLKPTRWCMQTFRPNSDISPVTIFWKTRDARLKIYIPVTQEVIKDYARKLHINKLTLQERKTEETHTTIL